VYKTRSELNLRPFFGPYFFLRAWIVGCAVVGSFFSGTFLIFPPSLTIELRRTGGTETVISALFLERARGVTRIVIFWSRMFKNLNKRSSEKPESLPLLNADIFG